MTQLGDELLVAYTDGELTTPQREAVQCVLDKDPAALQRIKSLKGARQRFQGLFDQMLEDYEDDADPLVNRILQIKHRTEATQINSDFPDTLQTTQASHTPQGTGEKQPPPSYVAPENHTTNTNEKTKAGLSSWSQGYKGILAGLVIGGVVASFGYYLLTSYSSGELKKTDRIEWSDGESSGYAPIVDADWKKAVLHHHTLASFMRSHSSQPPQDLRKAEQSVQGLLARSDFKIPDFSRQGLTFYRFEKLKHGSQLIGQFQFRGAEARFVSLYVKREKLPEAIERTELGEINGVHWSQNGIGYVLSGKEPYWSLMVLSVDIKRQSGFKQ